MAPDNDNYVAAASNVEFKYARTLNITDGGPYPWVEKARDRIGPDRSANAGALLTALNDVSTGRTHRSPPATLDLIGHSFGPNLLMIAGTILRPDTLLVNSLCERIKEIRLSRSIVAVRLLGCATADGPDAIALLRYIAARALVPAYGTNTVIGESEFDCRGFKEVAVANYLAPLTSSSGAPSMAPKPSVPPLPVKTVDPKWNQRLAQLAALVDDKSRETLANLVELATPAAYFVPGALAFPSESAFLRSRSAAVKKPIGQVDLICQGAYLRVLAYDRALGIDHLLPMPDDDLAGGESAFAGEVERLTRSRR